MKAHTKPRDNYVDLSTHDNVTISCSESRALLERIGIRGQLVHTPGHSEDSVSLLLDDGPVFTGDLTHPALAAEGDAVVVAESWRSLKELGATHVYPGHGPIRTIGDARVPE